MRKEYDSYNKTLTKEIIEKYLEKLFNIDYILINNKVIEKIPVNSKSYIHEISIKQNKENESEFDLNLILDPIEPESKELYQIYMFNIERIEIKENDGVIENISLFSKHPTNDSKELKLSYNNIYNITLEYVDRDWQEECKRLGIISIKE